MNFWKGKHSRNLNNLLIDVYDTLIKSDDKHIVNEVHNKKIKDYTDNDDYSDVINYITQFSNNITKNEINMSIDLLYCYFFEKEISEKEIVQKIYSKINFFNIFHSDTNRSIDIKCLKDDDHVFELETYEFISTYDKKELILMKLNELNYKEIEHVDCLLIYKFLKKEIFQDTSLYNKFLEVSYKSDKDLYKRMQKDHFVNILKSTNHRPHKS